MGKKAANNANAKNAAATGATDAPVTPANTNETATAVQNVRATAAVPAAPTQAPSPGKNATATKKTVVNNAKNVTSAKPFALGDITVASVQQARQVRKADLQRYQNFHNFFTANDQDAAQLINSKMTAKREQVDQWICGAVNPQTLTCIQEIQETQPAILELIVVSAAITKYGEKELARRDALGEMDNVAGARFGTSGLRSKQQMPHSVGVSFLLRLVLGLAPEKRATCQILREILSHEANAHLVLTPTSETLKPVFGAAAADTGDWDQLDQEKIKHMIKQTQSDKFQETMQQLDGGYLYDALRSQLKQAGGASFWDDATDKTALKNLRPRSSSADQSKKPQKQQQTVKKNGGKAQKPKAVEKKNLPVEVKVAAAAPPAPFVVKAVVPPPAPVVKETAGQTTGQTKKEFAPNKKNKKQQQKEKQQPEKNTAPKEKQQQEKNVAPVKNAAPVNNTTPVKNATPVKNMSAGTIVSNAPAGRAKISKKK